MSDNNQTIDQRERWNDLDESSRIAAESAQTDVWTSMPGIIVSHERDKNTVTVQPALKLKRIKSDGTAEWIQIPELADVPIMYPGGGGATMTLPMKKGDEVLLNFSARNIDKWHQQGGVQEQNVPFRMHDMSDGFAVPGFRSQPRKLSNVNENAAEIRTDDGTMVIQFDPVAKKITVKSPANNIRFETPGLEVTGEIIAKCDSTKIHVSTHTHAQGNDSHGDTEVEVNPPTANS